MSGHSRSILHSTKGNHVFKGFSKEQKAEMIRQGNAHRFEYHVFHAGDTHRIGRAAHSDVMDLFGERFIENRVAIVNGAAHANGMRPMPVYLFMDGTLWGVYQFESLVKGRIQFRETSFLFGDHSNPVVEGELRAFEWKAAAEDAI